MAPDTRAPRAKGQAGETLLESLIALAILALVAAAAYAGMTTSLRVSAQNRDAAVAEALLRSAAERLQDPATTYVPRAGCPGAGTYTDLPTRPGFGPVVASVRFWVPSAAAGDGAVPVTFAAKGSAQDCPATDPGLQAIDLSVLAPSGKVHRLEITKRAS